MDVQTLAARYPNVYHMAERGAWPSIRDRGLLSTVAVLDRAGSTGRQRARLLSEHRPEKMTVGQGTDAVVLRDQKPMEPERLREALRNGVTCNQWYETINSKVFFWAEEHRLYGLLNARAYRNLEHDVLTLSTASLVAAHAPEIWLCHMNSGNTFPMPHARDLSAFKRIGDYPTRANGSPLKDVVELVVDYQVLDIADHVIAVRRMRGQETLHPIPFR